MHLLITLLQDFKWFRFFSICSGELTLFLSHKCSKNETDFNMNNVEGRQGDFSHVCKRAYAVAFQTSLNTHTNT